MKCTILSCCLFIAFPVSPVAQTTVSGTVTDAATHAPLEMAGIMITGRTIGTHADEKGHFTLTASEPFTQITVSAMGYKTVKVTVVPDSQQVINIALIKNTYGLNEVVVRSGKKQKYSNKNNPAVDLIREVIAHKQKNRPGNYDYAEFRKYESMLLALSHLSDTFRNRHIFKNYQFLFTAQDSNAIGGRWMLPVYMEEKLSENYYRRSPYTQKQFVLASKQVKYDENLIDNKGWSSTLNFFYQDIDIYQNNIMVMTNQLLSPVAGGAPAFYKYFITDTTDNQVVLDFSPRSKTDLLFEGRLYIRLDSTYAISRAELTVDKRINLNFVRRMEANLIFDGQNQLKESTLKIDFGLSREKGKGMYGERIVKIDSFYLNKVKPAACYTGPAVEVAADAVEKDTGYWAANRPFALSGPALDVYKNMDSLQRVPSFKRAVNWATFLLIGFKNFGPFEIGPVNTFYSFNAVEGFRPRFGGRTTEKLSRRIYFEGYVAYGVKDERFKYFASATYSLNNKSIYTFPQHYIRVGFQHDTKIPGQELQFVQENNVLLSFKRGTSNQMLYNDFFRLEYLHEWQNHFSYSLGWKYWDQHPAGGLYFRKMVNEEEVNVSGIKTSELNMTLRYAPHEQFYQSKLYRTPITDKYPVFTLRYNQGIQGLLNGQYNYQHVALNMTKRFYLSQLGYTDVSAEGAYLFGQVPFPLLDIHRANQTYSFQLQSYNLMNFLEFVSDHYAGMNIDHHFNGFFFNKVPLLRRLKWREIVNTKFLWGGVRNENEGKLLLFPSGTYSLSNGPYIEGSVGISNIFRILRVDAVKRFTYLAHPEAPSWGVRAMLKFDF
ncbi:DUF5686 family protein [Chitinophaga sp.]|uniref:DUF5686 and carboxypeptidase-like regulatory domain-containing protein n=1 Tax=Chitinophaga sp. TaxID=1869181 RepID=UPI0031D3DB2C